ncbi:MAG: sigma 54-interacting transcriptional regulator [Pirellulales bacterium]
MARTGLSDSSLKRLLAESPVPIYAVDDGRVVIYANDGLLAWLGTTREHVVGQRLAYHALAPDEPTELFLHGLCPPPHLAGWGMGTVFRVTPDGGRETRGALWMPLRDGGVSGDRLGIVLPAEGLPTGDQAVGWSVSEAEALHAALGEFRQSLARRYGWYRLVGDSPSVRRIRRQIRVAADAGCAVLVHGSPGSGREHIARTIHYQNPRLRSHPIVPLNCPLLDLELLAATIDGLVNRGVELQSHGAATLLLLEIDGLSEPCQQLLYERLQEPDCELRTLSTSAAPLIGAGRNFSRPLAELLSTLVIEVDSLADRRSDIPLLAQSLLEQLNATESRQLTGFTREALDRLVLYSWPRGADELAEVIRQAAQQATGPMIVVADLPDRLELVERSARVPREPRASEPLDGILMQTERQAIVDALARAKGNKSRAAKLLQISRARLIRRAQQLSILTGETPEEDRGEP